MEEKKYVKISLTSVILLFIILVLLVIIAIGGIYIYKNRNKEVEVENKNEIVENSEISTENKEIEKQETKIAKDENGNVKSIIADLNNDGKAETVEFNYNYEDLGTEPAEMYINKINTKLIENDGEKTYTKDFEEDMYFDINIEVVDIDEQDNYKEIKISYIPTDASPQWYFNYFLRYDGQNYDFMKINRDNDEYLMYEMEEEADDYIISAIGENEEKNENKLKIENKTIKAYSFIDQEETYELESNGQLVLTKSRFAGTKEMYNEYFKTWGPGLVYEQKDLNSNSRVYVNENEEDSDFIKTETFEVLNIEDHWLEVKVNNKAGYISFENVYNLPGT